MNDQDKTREELIRELLILRRRVAHLEEADQARRVAEEALKQSEERYRSIFQMVPVSIWEEDYTRLSEAIATLKAQGVTDFRGWLDDHPDFIHQAALMIKVADVNDETLKMYRAESKEELLGSPSRVLLPQSWDAFREELIAIAEGKNTFETEGLTHTLRGERRNVLVRIAIPSSLSDFRHMLLSVMDISDSKQAEQALRRSEERFRAIFEGARDCIFIKDRDLRYSHVNPAMEKLLMRPASLLIGLRSEDIYGEEAGKHIREVDLRALSGESIEEEHSRPINGFHFTFLDIREPLRNAEGEIIGICGISRNVTERKLATHTFDPSTADYPSSAMRSTLAKARYAAATDSVVLLLGESGSGKDFLARYIHAHSRRDKGPFFAINCAALSHELAESELFGHEPGAFTGARGRKRGLLELAEGGTLLLNEIGELSLTLQSKLLTFLDTRSFTRVGGEKTISVNARLIAATHRDLREEIAHGRFLSALFYRLDVFSIRVPALRERREDIPLLVEELTAKLMVDLHLTDAPPLDANTVKDMTKHDWPGNVRELRNVIERALILPDRGSLEFPFSGREATPDEWSYKLRFPSQMSLHELRHQITQALCMEALRRADGNKKAAAELLGISRYSLYRYMTYYDIEEGEKVTAE
ncbi:MAG: sigma 54-interacting transcriptional regulator [Desulfomonile tiedjei]|nr:sigma 54-interacting transcriptional regulator [Desulfomonile tiedjei]